MNKDFTVMGQQISPNPNREGATYTVGDGDYNEEDYRNLGTLYNYDDSMLDNSGTLYNNGVIDNQENQLGSKGFINKGIYTGTGVILGSWTDHGTVKPCNSAGGMLVDGSYYKEGGSTKIELGGIDDGDGDRTATKHDWIKITGNLKLKGDLDVSFQMSHQMSH